MSSLLCTDSSSSDQATRKIAERIASFLKMLADTTRMSLQVD